MKTVSMNECIQERKKTMDINELKGLMKKCKIELKNEISEDKTIGELGLDSLDIMMLTFEINKIAGQELTFSPNDTVADVLGRVNRE